MRWLGLLLVLGSVGCGLDDRAVLIHLDHSFAVDGPRAIIRGADATTSIVPADASAAGDMTTCVFINATSSQNCGVATSYPGPLAFECTGTGSCSVDVIAPAGTELQWKSTCGGYAYSVVDDRPDTIAFECGAEPTFDVVTCEFKNATAAQSCSSSGVPGPFRCTGTSSCEVWTSAKQGTTLTWTSSCGGAATTVVDGVKENVLFTCN